MPNYIAILETQTLLRESFQMILETHASNKVVDCYEYVRPFTNGLNVVFLDIPNFFTIPRRYIRHGFCQRNETYSIGSARRRTFCNGSNGCTGPWIFI